VTATKCGVPVATEGRLVAVKFEQAEPGELHTWFPGPVAI